MVLASWAVCATRERGWCENGRHVCPLAVHSARTGASGARCSPDGSVRPTYQALHDALDGLGLEEFRARSESLARSYLDQGITRLRR